MTQPSIGKFHLHWIGANHSVIVNFKESCWQCGTETNITKAHVIPQSFEPKNNLIIPLCRSCHDRLDGFRNRNDGKPKVLAKLSALENELKQLKEKLS